MARLKQYNEEDVLFKAMNLFWKNGFEATSVKMLESELGINKFSIYSSFGSKNGLFLSSLKCYKKELFKLLKPLASDGVGGSAIKNYFYDFIEFSKEKEFGKGCLITNTANEMNADTALEIKNYINSFTMDVKQVFVEVLNRDAQIMKEHIPEKADYLLLAMFGLSSASKMFNKSQLENFIEYTFKTI